MLLRESVEEKMQFEEKVQQEINGFSPRQVVHFSWLCAVRSLPILGASEVFSFKEKEREWQVQLYSMFNDMDVAIVQSTNSFADWSVTSTYNAIYATTNITDALIAASNAYDVHSHIGAEKKFATILYNDIVAIKNDSLETLYNKTDVYGEVWDCFLENLIKIDCGYWAKLYSDIFAKIFVVNEDELLLRLSVPDEIKTQGASSVGRYLQGLTDINTAGFASEARIIIVGDKGAGKTSLARKLINIHAPMPSANESTEGISIAHWRVQDEINHDINIHIWDFAGDVITHAVHRCFLQPHCLYIYLYDGRRDYSDSTDYWLSQIRNHAEDAPVLFLVNKLDGVYEPCIPQNALIREYPSIKSFHSFNISKDIERIKDFQSDILDIIRNYQAFNYYEKSTYFHSIKEKLSSHFLESQSDFITQEEFHAFGKNAGLPSENYSDVLNYLNSLGVCLQYHFKDKNHSETLVLNPVWIVEGIYSIIRGIADKRKYTLTIDDALEIFKNSKNTTQSYPKDKIDFIFQLMCKFELAFSLEDKKITIPSVLPIDKPFSISTSIFSGDDCLRMVYEVEKILPPNIISRVMVKRYEEVDNVALWRKGVVLHYPKGDAIALIVEDSRTITVDVKGIDQTNYIAELRNTFNDIFNSYNNISPRILYKVLMPSDKPFVPLEQTTAKPYLIHDKQMLAYYQLNRPILNIETMKNIPIHPILNMYAIEPERVECLLNIDNRCSSLPRFSSTSLLSLGKFTKPQRNERNISTMDTKIRNTMKKDISQNKLSKYPSIALFALVAIFAVSLISFSIFDIIFSNHTVLPETVEFYLVLRGTEVQLHSYPITLSLQSEESSGEQVQYMRLLSIADSELTHLIAYFSTLIPMTAENREIISIPIAASSGSMSGHSFSITTDGTLLAWGRNDFGQLGDGTNINRLYPVEVMFDVASVVVGNAFSLAITNDGGLYAWGYNGHGRLGTGTMYNSSSPIRIMDDVVFVTTDVYHSLAITNDGSLWAWGWNHWGQVGNDTTESQYTPIKIMDNVTYAVAGHLHSLAITNDGILWAWGYNGLGSLGDGTREHRHMPVEIKDDVVTITAGESSSFAITSDGVLWAWGRNTHGRLGDGTLIGRISPVRIMDNVISVSAGSQHSFAITLDGTLWGWGNNSHGQIGDGTNEMRLLPVTIMNDVETIVGGRFYSLALTSCGSLWSWGDNGYGQLGDGSHENSLHPQRIMENMMLPTS